MAQTAQKSSRGIDAWRRKIVGSDTPIFARTVSEVSAVAGNEDTSAKDLSDVIGQDASMATRLLRIAGSSLFNLQGRKIDTISGAVVLIGFDAVREFAVSLALIEHVLKGRQHHRVTKYMAQAFHAAVQAKSFAETNKDKNSEEIFVAALLRRLGEMSFWAHGSPEGDAIEQLVERGVALEEAEQQVLGFPLSMLTCELADEWKLGSLLTDAINGSTSKQDGGRSSVNMGHEVAVAVESFGWESKQTKDVLIGVADELGVAVGQVERMVRENFEEAVKIAERYGVPKIDAQLPPLPKPAQMMQPDEAFASQTLEELAEGQHNAKPLNELLVLALQGIHQGGGFDRTYFALLTPDRTQLQPRYALGVNPDGFSGASRPFLKDGDLFQFLLKKGEAVRLSPGRRAESPGYRGWLCATECALMPIVVNDKPVGVLYADRADSQRSVDDAAYASFRQFGEQIVALLTSTRK